MATRKNWIGRSVTRRDGLAKLTGKTKYIDDIEFPDMIHGVTVRSRGPRARIRGIRFDDIPGVRWDEITVVTAKDIPAGGHNYIAMIQNDQIVLADGLTSHPEEAVVLLAHPDRGMLEDARRAVVIEEEKLPAVLSIDEALEGKTVIWGADNVFKRFEIKKGDVESAFRGAHRVVEGVYETGAQEQLYIENNGMVARASPEAGVTVWGSMQCPYYVHKALVSVFGLPAERVRVVQVDTGGGFGGKEDYPSLLAAHAALLAWKSGRTVKMINDRAEDMAATTKRHPSRSRVRSAWDAKGKLLALDFDFTLDGGAYLTLSPVVLSRGTIHAAGPYFCENVRVTSRAVATSTPPNGAFRGFGAPQSIFAMERHLDEAAVALGIDPIVLRKRNFIRRGQTTATGQVIHEDFDLGGLLDRAVAKAGLREKRTAYAKSNPKSAVKRGIGLAAFMHGAGFTGSGEKYLESVVGVEGTHDGRLRILTANTEIGQGTNTIFCQIAADAVGIALEKVEVAQPDTSQVPNSGPTVASRTTMIVGKLVERAARLLMDVVAQAGFRDSDPSRAIAKYVKAQGGKPARVFSQYRAPPGIEWDDKTYRGDAYGTYAWAVYVADVEVDTVTGETRVADFVALQEVGKVVNPVLAEGQIEGGVAQGIGYALYEKVAYREGRMANSQMTNYIVPTSLDTPPIRVFFEENPYAHGPGGAKGIGELPMDGPAPAVLNAVSGALGTSFRSIPLLPEEVLSRC